VYVRVHAGDEDVPFAAHVQHFEEKDWKKLQVSSSQGTKASEKFDMVAKKVLWLCLPAENLQPYFWNEDLLKRFVDKATAAAGVSLAPDRVEAKLKLWSEAGRVDDILSPFMYASTCFEEWSRQVTEFQNNRNAGKRKGVTSVLKEFRKSAVDVKEMTDVCRKLFSGRYLHVDRTNLLKRIATPNRTVLFNFLNALPVVLCGSTF
jgi:hypothetical protein